MRMEVNSGYIQWQLGRFIIGGPANIVELNATEDPAILQLGGDDAGTVAQTLKSNDRITSDGVGGDLTIAPGRGRGDVGGSLIFQTAPTIAAGSSGVLATRFTINPQGDALLTGGTLAAESLNEVDFAAETKWTDSADFPIATGKAIYTHSGGTGSITQTLGNQAVAVKANRLYKFVYVLSAPTGTPPVATITTATALVAVTLNTTTAATYTTYFRSAAVPGSFVISVTSGAAGSFTLDDISLKEVTDGSLYAGGTLYPGALVTDATATIGNVSTYDRLILSPVVKGAGQFDLTLSTLDLTAARAINFPNVSGTLLIAMYGGMYQYTGAAATTIGTVWPQYHALTQMVTGLQQGFTFIAGTGSGAGAAIASIATAGGGNITVTAPGTWVAGQPVTIHNTANHDGVYQIITGGNGSFVIAHATSTTDTGLARGACALKANVGSAGTYEIGFTMSATTAANSINFHVEANKNILPLDNVASRAQTSTNSKARVLAGLGHVAIADGDVIWLSISNDTEASNITIDMVNTTVKRIGS